MKFLLLLSLFFISFCIESDFEIKYDNWDNEKIMNSLRYTYIEVDASFGSNMDKFKLELDTLTQATVIPDVNCTGCKNVKRFNISASNTFNIEKKDVNSYGVENFHQGTFGNDNFKLGKDDNNKQIISFIVAKEYKYLSKPHNYAFLGLRSFVNGSEYKYNIIEQMKEKDIIPNSTWFLNFDSDTKGKFVIGTLPHIKYKDIYSFDDSYTQNSEERYIYALKMQEIYYGKISNYDQRKSGDKNHCVAKFNINTRLFKCPSDFGDILYNNFFSQKIADKVCDHGILIDNYIYYYCYKDKFKMSEMENLNFVADFHTVDNMTFVFEPKDLFYEHEGILYFLVIYKHDDYDSQYPDTEWEVGTGFLKKYMLTFNINRQISFYSKKIGEDEEPNNENLKYIIIIVILSVVFLACIAFLIYYIMKIKPRKKKANELDDDFDYQAKQNEEGTSALINDEN